MSGDPMTRRSALKYASLITLAAYGWRSSPVHAALTPAKGYGRDPDLQRRTVTWPRTLSAEQLTLVSILCDIVLPAEPPHPSAAALGVHGFIDEWVSAPYLRMQQDRTIILDGLAALDNAMRQERGVNFTQAATPQQIALFERFCDAESTKAFMRRLIELACDGYYPTREGHAAIGYVGNVGLTTFPGAPPEVVQHLERALAALPATRAHTDRQSQPNR